MDKSPKGGINMDDYKKYDIILPLPCANWLETLHEVSGVSYSEIVLHLLCNTSPADLSNYINNK